MTAALRYLHLLGLVVWLGGVVFFSFVVAPTLFQTFPRETAGRATAAIFPRYYLVGVVCGVWTLLTAGLLALRPGRSARAAIVEMLVLTLMTGTTLYAGYVILPEAQRIRASLPALEGTPEHASAQARWALLHRRSVRLNGLVLVLGLGALWFAVRRP